jgi:hypothetical protein
MRSRRQARATTGSLAESAIEPATGRFGECNSASPAGCRTPERPVEVRSSPASSPTWARRKGARERYRPAE